MLNMPTTTPISHTPIAAQQPVLKVLGLGGGGCNAVNRMIELGINGVQFIAANTDHQALQTCLAPIKIQLGPKVTRGLGAGGKPEVGKAAAEESQREIAAALAGADMVFLAAGMGGGTGTGSIPVAAKIARALKAVTIAVVTTPFSFEMGRRQNNAKEGLSCLRPHTDTLISIPNDRLLFVAPRDLPMEVAFRLADDVLRQGVQGITELITEPGMINVDFAHIHHLMKLGGGALMSIGQGHGVDKALRAVEQALNHPLLETASLENAAGILANFSAGNDLSLFEIEAALNYLQERTGGEAEIVMGVTNDCNLRDRVEVFLVITGMGAPTLEETLANVKPSFRMVEAPPQPEEELPPSPPPAPMFRPSIQQSIPPSASQNLDIPAFLRKNRI